MTDSAFDRLSAPAGYGAVTPDRLGQLLAENVALRRELAEVRAHLAVIEEQRLDLIRLAEIADRPHFACSNGA